jgi:hypothetical protein
MDNQVGCFLVRLRLVVRCRFSLASSFRTLSFGTLNTARTALSRRFHGVLPGTNTGSRGFMRLAFQRKLEPRAYLSIGLCATYSSISLAWVICRAGKTLFV